MSWRFTGAALAALSTFASASCERSSTNVEPVPTQAAFAPPTVDPLSLQGAILPGAELASQLVIGEPVPPLKADKPDTYVFHEAGEWLNIEGLDADRLLRGVDADARFNDDDAAHRISFHYSHFGGMPVNAGDFNGDGVHDLLITDHFSWVDGSDRTGEVHLYFGRRDEMIDPTTDKPDVIFYGEEIWGKLGITIAAGGDFNGDGRADLLLSAGYATTTRGDETTVANAGKVYLVFGGTFDVTQTTTKIRVAELGVSLPGVVFEGGHDDSRQVVYANGLEAGDFNGDGVDDIIIGSYNPYAYNNAGDALDWPARAYLIYGRAGEPLSLRSYRLGVEGDAVLQHHLITSPSRDWTRASLGWSTNFLGDINADGYADLGFGTSYGGVQERGGAYIFLGGPDRLAPGGATSVTDADIVISATDDPISTGHGELVAHMLPNLRPAGDVNGDGVGDILVPSRGAKLRRRGESVINVGAVAVYHGRRDWPDALSVADAEHVFYGTRDGTMGQPAMDFGADLNGDGRADLLINDAYYDDWLDPREVQARGRLWVIGMSEDMPRTLAIEENADLTVLPDTRTPGLFGYTWTTGDWNGDGRADIAIGDHYAGDRLGNVHAGKVYLFYNGWSLNLPRSSPRRPLDAG